MSGTFSRFDRAETGELTPPRLRGWSHVVAALGALVLVPITISLATDHRARVAIFALAIVALFTVSGLYHRIFWPTRFRWLFQRVDHSMIYLAIAAIYNAIVPWAVPGSLGTAILWIVWTLACIGVAVKIFWPTVPPPVTYILFGVIGWTIAPAAFQVWEHLGYISFGLLLLGGIFHSLGAAVFAFQKPNPSPIWFGFHEIFHLCVIAGVVAHYLVVVRVVTS